MEASSSHHKVLGKSKNTQKILFLSTNIYRGNLGLFVKTENDFDQSKFELDLIKNSFSKVNKEIEYKAYPMETLRYFDYDPVTLAAIKTDNLKVIQEKKDIRYFIQDYDLIITTHATSTLSWPLFADIPTCFINNEYNMPLKNEVKTLFENGAFIFNRSDENFFEQLTSFINQDLSEIKKQWRSKKENRVKLIHQYFSSSNTSQRKQIENIIRQRKV